MEKVFEIGRQFRNEGADFKHNPEFTSLELYETYGDYNDMRVLTQELIQEAATAVYGSPVARRADADGHDHRVRPLRRLAGQADPARRSSEALGEEVTADTPSTTLRAHAERIGLELDPGATLGRWCWRQLYEELCEGSDRADPGLLHRLPQGERPADPAHREDPRLAEKWDLVIFGAEQATAYSELIDPVDQRERLVAQSLLRRGRRPGGDAASTRTSSRRSSTACRRPVAWAWASTGW